MIARWLQQARIRRSLKQIVNAHEKRGTFSGAVLVKLGDTTVLRTAAGFADREHHLENTPETTFRIGSAAKTFTALAVLRLADDGRLSVDDPLSRYLPDFPNGERIRIHHLLSNTSGIPDFIMDDVLQTRAEQAHTLTEVIGYFRNQALHFEPGDRLSYSNSNWTLLVAIIETVCDCSFSEALNALVLHPLKFEHTFIDVGEHALPGAAGYSISEGKWLPVPPMHASIELGAGGLRSTVDDISHLAEVLGRPGFLKPATLASMRTSVAASEGLDYGYGLCLSTRFGQATEGHPGGTSGFTTFWTHFPQVDVTIVVTANVENGSAEGLEKNLAAACLGEPFELPKSRSFISIPPDILDQYTGRYRSDYAGRPVDFTIERDGDKLLARFPLLPKATLQALTPKRFFMRLKGSDVLLDFEISPGHSQASNITVDWGGMPFSWPRIDRDS